MFHYSRCVSPRAINQPLPLAITEDWELQVQPETILAVRINEAGQEVLVKWDNLLHMRTEEQHPEGVSYHPPPGQCGSSRRGYCYKPQVWQGLF